MYIDKPDGRIDAASFDRMAARRLFEKQEASEQKRLLDFLASNCSWKDGQLTAEFRQPFDSLADTAMAAAAASTEARSESAKTLSFLNEGNTSFRPPASG